MTNTVHLIRNSVRDGIKIRETNEFMSRWLVAVDDSTWASYAFNHATMFANVETDRIYLIHVTEEIQKVYVGYASTSLLESFRIVEEQKARKILVHYGHKAQALGFTMMKGADSNPGDLICKAVSKYDITNVVIGRRSMGGVKRFFVGSTSKYVVENAECNVIVVKQPVGVAEEHDSKASVIQAEESERLRREEEGPPEVHDSNLSEVKRAEEAERRRRLKEDSEVNIERLFSIYKFHDELIHKM